VLTESDICPNCSLPTSKRWRGYVIIRDPASSQVAKKMNITKPGKYALKVM
jgi:DNA-directed RNA polymerase subunit E"